MKNTFKKLLLSALLATMPFLVQAAVGSTQPSTCSALTKLGETHHALVYADAQRANHGIIVSKNSHTDSPSIYAHLCFAAQKIPTDFTLFIDPMACPQECSLCKKINMQWDVVHAHVVISQGSRPVPVHGPCPFCKIVKGKVVPGIKKDGRTISESETALLFTKSKGPRILNNCMAVPKNHIVNIKDMTSSDIPLITDALTLTQQTMAQHGLSYVLVTNNGSSSPCHQSVPHMHFHLESPNNCRFSPEKFGWATTPTKS